MFTALLWGDASGGQVLLFKSVAGAKQLASLGTLYILNGKEFNIKLLAMENLVHSNLLKPIFL